MICQNQQVVKLRGLCTEEMSIYFPESLKTRLCRVYASANATSTHHSEVMNGRSAAYSGHLNADQ